VLGALPRFVWVLLFAILYGDRPAWIGLGVGVAGAPALALALRARIQELRRVSFVEASVLHGVSVAEVLVLHLIGTASRRLIARHLVELFVASVVVEATLGYIGGFGVQQPAPSWGNMIAFSFGQREGNALAWIAPAVALQAVVATGALLAGAIAEGERGLGGGGG
jgi:peptide/nickel transport system permease protein